MIGYILVEMPESCGTKCEIYESCRQRFKPCPITPLPEKKTRAKTIFETISNDSWNRCLDVIEGGNRLD